MWVQGSEVDKKHEIAIIGWFFKKFAKWILDIGDGKLGCDNDGDAVVEIPYDNCIHHSGNLVVDNVSSTYPSLIEGIEDIKFFLK